MNNKTNLNQVVDAKNIIVLLNKNPGNLITILFTDTKKQEGQLVKKKFVKLSKEFIEQPCFFIFIDKGNFNNPDNSIKIDYNETSYFLIFFNGHKISSVNGPDINVCKLNITKILEKMNNVQNNTEHDDNDDNDNDDDDDDDNDDDDNDDDDIKEKEKKPKKENKKLSQEEIIKMKQSIQFKRMQKMMMLRRLKMMEKNQINMQMNLINQLERLSQSKKKMENDSDSD